MIDILLEKYMLKNTQVKIYDSYIVTDVEAQKKYINTIVLNLIEKILNK